MILGEFRDISGEKTCEISHLEKRRTVGYYIDTRGDTNDLKNKILMRNRIEGRPFQNFR